MTVMESLHEAYEKKLAEERSQLTGQQLIYIEGTLFNQAVRQIESAATSGAPNFVFIVGLQIYPSRLAAKLVKKKLQEHATYKIEIDERDLEGHCGRQVVLVISGW